MNPVPPNAPTPPAATGAPADPDDINWLKLLDVVLDGRWLIAGVTVLAVLLGAAYAVLTTPIYEANTLIQVAQGGPGSMLLGIASNGGNAGNLFQTQSSAEAEMQILRSRLVVGQAVADMHLGISVTPKYVPVIGRWLARRATAPSNPGFLGMKGYVSGDESLKVAQFDVPPKLEGRRFTVVLMAQGYELRSPTGARLGQGVPGQPLDFELNAQKGRLLVAGAVGKPGAEFELRRDSRLAATQSLQRRLNIAEQGRASGVILVSMEGANPTRIARVLNEIGKLYVNQNVERKAAEAEKSLQFLDTQLPLLRKQLEVSEDKFNQFRNRKGVFELSDEAKLLLDQLVTGRIKLLEMQEKRRDLEARFTAEHPVVQALDANIRSWSAEMDKLEAKIKTLPNVEQGLVRLTRDVKVDSGLYVAVLNTYQQLRLVKAGAVGDVRVVDVAAVPEVPVWPKLPLLLAVAIVLGLLAGLALAYMRSSLRTGVRDAAEIEQRAGLTVFATVPHSAAQVKLAEKARSKSPGTHVLALVSPQDHVVESLRSLRTALQFAMSDTSNNVVLITGPTPQTGKSFTSVNFATVLGAADKKVLLIDADLRKGHLNQYFGLDRSRGLSEILSGGVKFEAALHRQVVPNVDFLPTGTLPPNPAELLLTSRLRDLLQQSNSRLHDMLQQLSGQYDLVLIDTAPVLAASDTAIVAALAGTVFLVARAEITSVAELQESVKRLAQNGVKTEGVIFNDLNISKRRYRYGLGYRYGGYRYTNYKY